MFPNHDCYSIFMFTTHYLRLLYVHVIASMLNNSWLRFFFFFFFPSFVKKELLNFWTILPFLLHSWIIMEHWSFLSILAIGGLINWTSSYQRGYKVLKKEGSFFNLVIISLKESSLSNSQITCSKNVQCMILY